MPPKALKRKGPGPGFEPSPKKKKFSITFTKCDPTLAFTDAKKPRPQRFDPVAQHIWRDKIQEGCKTAFARLEMRDDPSVRDAILRRIEAGRDVDPLRHSAPCFTVHRGNLNSKSPFQIQACGARIVAQKAIYAAYCNVTTEDMGTWQVRQKCCHPDGSWWCFEPSHLEKCDRDHLPPNTVKHKAPTPAQAVYISQSRQSCKSKATAVGAKLLLGLGAQAQAFQANATSCDKARATALISAKAAAHVAAQVAAHAAHAAARAQAAVNAARNAAEDAGIIYTTEKENETPLGIAMTLGCSAIDLVAQNRIKYKGLQPQSRLKKGTTLTYGHDEVTGASAAHRPMAKPMAALGGRAMSSMPAAGRSGFAGGGRAETLGPAAHAHAHLEAAKVIPHPASTAADSGARWGDALLLLAINSQDKPVKQEGADGLALDVDSALSRGFQDPG